MSERLVALLNGREIGTVDYDKSRLSFTYAQTWRDDPEAYPLSLSMPLGAATHGHARVDAFLWGLLPDNDRVLQTWAQRFQVSPRNAFRLIAHVGEDCAGAVQFVRPDRVEALVAGGSTDKVQWLTTKDVAHRLADLVRDPAEGRVASDRGQFSLAGAQPKTALLKEKGRWGVPQGRIPTTHILKPPTGDWVGHAENEHFCLQLARAVGLMVPNSAVEHFEDQVTIVVERFDRLHTKAGWTRIHQEDFCQTLGVHPAKKYESDGGPGVAALADVLRAHSTVAEEDLWSLMDGVAFNWLIAGTDAHAKNYALLLGPGVVRLAPFYDLASILPYANIDRRKAKLAMKLGGEYLLQNIALRHWQRLAQTVHLPAEALVDRVRNLARQLPDQIEAVRKACLKEKLMPNAVDPVAQALMERMPICFRQLGL